MTKFTQLTPAMGLFAVLAATMMPMTAFAGEETRAEAAIAEAKGKIDAGDKVGAADQAPDLQGQARQALITAQDLLSHHHKSEALATAQHASELADQALATANRRKDRSEIDRRDAAHAAEANAQQSVMSADNRASNAETARSDANTRANAAEAATTAANLRADQANQSSAAANAQMDAMRATPTTTTMAVTQHDTVEQQSATPARHHRHHHVVRHHAHTAHVKTTTTEVTTTH